jgi:hypothetical protein
MATIGLDRHVGIFIHKIKKGRRFGFPGETGTAAFCI